jgi:hypothetical protein
MPVVGVNLTKIHAVRNVGSKGGKVNINNNFTIKEVEANEFAGDTSKKTLRVGFLFNCTYDPNLGSINLEGNVLVVDNAKTVDDISQQWEKSKNLPVELTEKVTNAALHKCNIQAIKLSEDIRLPSPIYLPRVKAAENK